MIIRIHDYIIHIKLKHTQVKTPLTLRDIVVYL